jgi:hypothetical protein
MAVKGVTIFLYGNKWNYLVLNLCVFNFLSFFILVTILFIDITLQNMEKLDKKLTISHYRALLWVKKGKLSPTKVINSNFIA